MLLDLPALAKKYDIKCTGVIHAGAHTAEELPIYQQLDWHPITWVEANPELAGRLIAHGHNVVTVAAGADFGKAQFHVTSLSGSSSLLEPGLNLEWRKDLKVDKVITVPVWPIRAFQKWENFLNLDIQGAELEALQGTDLIRIDYIYTEVHKVPTYIDCPLIGELDDFLVNFKRVETKWVKDRWGDALYIRR